MWGNVRCATHPSPSVITKTGGGFDRRQFPFAGDFFPLFIAGPYILLRWPFVAQAGQRSRCVFGGKEAAAKGVERFRRKSFFFPPQNLSEIAVNAGGEDESNRLDLSLSIV